MNSSKRILRSLFKKSILDELPLPPIITKYCFNNSSNTRVTRNCKRKRQSQLSPIIEQPALELESLENDNPEEFKTESKRRKLCENFENDSIATKTVIPTRNKANTVGTGDRWYAIFIPQEDTAITNDVDCVVKGLQSTLAILKRNTHCRFQAADSEEMAWSMIHDPTPSSAGDACSNMMSPLNKLPNVVLEQDQTFVKPLSNGRNRRGRLSLPASLNTVGKANSDSLELKSDNLLVGEIKDTRFPTPKTQELTAMAREIASFKNAAVIDRVKANPKMLVNDCDRPTTVQEGCRYNALHVAAKANNSEIISFILNTVSSVEYIQTLYPKCRKGLITDRIKYITDAYLNTPDKMANETPLHFASKFLCVNAVKILARHPWSNTQAINLQKETPFDIAGSRGDSNSPNYNEKRRDICNILQSMYIVPVWRDSEGMFNPILGEVSHIRQLGNKLPQSVISFCPDFDMNILDDCEKSLYPKKTNSRNFSTLFEAADEWNIKAFAGPTVQAKATEFLSILKTTCGRGSLYMESPNPSHLFNSTPIVGSTFPESNNMNTSGYRTPPRTPRSSLTLLSPSSPFPESPLRHSNYIISSPNSPGPKDLIIRRKDPEKGFERMGRKFAMQNCLDWSEEWAFLDFYGDISSEAGLKALENKLLAADGWENEYQIGADDSCNEYENDKCQSDQEQGEYESDSESQSTCHSLELKFKLLTLLDSSDESGEKAEHDASQEDDSDSDSQEEKIANESDSQEYQQSDCGSQSSWHSAASSINDNEEFEDCLDQRIYFLGKAPSKYDFQIFVALKDREDIIVSESYPMLYQWFNTMKTLDEYDDYDNPKSIAVEKSQRLRYRDVSNLSSSETGRRLFQDA